MALTATEWANSRSLIPIVPKGKKPLIEWKEFTERIATPEERAEWRKRWPDMNYGLVTGSVSGYIVLDFDKDKGRALFSEHMVAGTCAVNITANGFHGLFAVESEPIGNSTGVVPGLDVRGEGGYIVIPPSVHPSGVKYRLQIPPWVLRPAPPLPDWFLVLLKAKETADRAAVPFIVPSASISFDDFAREHGCEVPPRGWVPDGVIHRCDAYGPDGKLGRGDGSYKVHIDPPVIGYVQNHHRHAALLTQQWRPAR